MFIENIESLRKYAARFAADLDPHACVALHGDLGAGKTEFARAVIQTLCGDDTVVPSPTFTLAQTYTVAGQKQISHFDLYRLKTPAELEEIGFFDALARDMTIVEWPEIAERFLPPNAVHVFLKADGGGRIIDVITPDQK